MFVDCVLPASTSKDNIEFVGELNELEEVTFEPVGKWYEAHCCKCHNKNFSFTSLESINPEVKARNLTRPENFDDNAFSTFDHKEWKNQDHYAVIGLGHLRHNATRNEIRKAYLKNVLHVHPDKMNEFKGQRSEYLTCAKLAHELLLDPVRRRSYDSVDPCFDDSIPPNNANSKQNFFKVFAPVFERNSRWSTKKEVPQLGDENTPFEKVDEFYSFWYNFESWREFSYLDEEDKQKGDNRDERKLIDKQNKAMRLKRKKEEMQRIRQLVDTAYECDPRISRHKAEERERKKADKRAKQEATRLKAEEEEKKRLEALEAERLIKEKEEEEAKAQQAAQKREKEQQKKNTKKEKKKLRTFAKEFDFLANNEQEKIQNMQDFDKLCELCSVDCLIQLNEAATSGDRNKFSEAFRTKLNEINEKLEEEKRKQMEAITKKYRSEPGSTTSTKDQWTEQEIQTLIKAVNLFPAGTNARWETISNFLKIHVPDCKKNAKEALAKAKDLQNDPTLKEDANKKAFENFAKETRSSNVAVPTKEVSERYETPAEVQVYEVGSNPAPWTPEEQKLLEQAMRTYPANLPDRWDKIAECIPMRTKKDCMVRYKELVELIRTKKLAQAAAMNGRK